MHLAHGYKSSYFFLITFLITGISWFTAAYCSYQKGMADLQLFSMLLGLLGPCIAMLFMFAGKKNKALRKDFYARLHVQPIKLRYLSVLLLLMPCVLFLATTISLLFGQPITQFCLTLGHTAMDGQGLSSLLIIFLAPTIEEIAWRGYGVDSLRSKFSLWNTTILFASLWALWHVPLFFINGYYQHTLWHTSIVSVVNFFISILPAAILINWMYYKNNRNILVAILLHFMFDFFSILFQTEQFTKWIVTILLLIVSLVVILKNKEFFFNKGLL